MMTCQQSHLLLKKNNVWKIHLMQQRSTGNSNLSLLDYQS